MKTTIKKTLSVTLVALSLFSSQPGQAGEFEMVMWSAQHPALAALLFTTFSPTLIPGSVIGGISGISAGTGLRREEVLATKEDALQLLESGVTSPMLAEVFSVVRTNFPETQKTSDKRLAVQLLQTIDADAF